MAKKKKKNGSKQNKNQEIKNEKVEEIEVVEKKEPEEKKEKKVESRIEKEIEKKKQEEKAKMEQEKAVEAEQKKENSPKKESHVKEEKPNYVESETKKKNKVMVIIILIICILLIVALCSTVFAFLNLNSNRIVRGLTIRNIDVSDLTETEAIGNLETKLGIELNSTIELVYQDFKTSLDTKEFEFTYNIPDAIKNAYSYGRDKSIVENNYAILYANLFGKKIDIDSTYKKEALDYIINDISTKLPGLVEEPSHYREGSELIIQKGKDGIALDKAELKRRILEDIESRNYSEIQANNKERTIQIPVVNKKADKIDIDKVYKEVYCEPKDAYYEENPFKIYKEEEGVDFNITIEEAKKIVENDDEESYKIPLKLTPASKTINDIGKEAFPYKISEFPTRYDATNRNRSKNLEIATGKINGTVLMPGETFSFNQVVGKRTIDEGYRDAKIFANGKVVDGLAGGICQVSSTLYNAVLLANLEIVERSNHSFTTSYIKAGRDATVVYGVKDFKFKNNRSYPIKIEGSVGSGIIQFTIHGIEEEKEYEIKIIPVTTGSIPYGTQTITDSKLAPGQRVVDQSGHAGCKVTTYKEVWYNGVMVSKELLSNDTYSAMQTIVRVGPAAKQASTPEETPKEN